MGNSDCETKRRKFQERFLKITPNPEEHPGQILTSLPIPLAILPFKTLFYEIIHRSLNLNLVDQECSFDPTKEDKRPRVMESDIN